MQKPKATDTTPEMQKIFDDLMASKSPEERVLMGVSMFQSSKLMILERLKRENPGVSKQRLKDLLIKDLYGIQLLASVKRPPPPPD